MEISSKLNQFLKELQVRFPLPMRSIAETPDFEECLILKLEELSLFCREHGLFEDLCSGTETIFEKVSRTIKQSLSEYLGGNASYAHRIFHEGMQSYLGLFDRKILLEKPLVLFRLRRNEQYPFEKKDIFHIPFKERRHISTCRYSIPGWPSLYLSDSVNLCFEEIHRPGDTIYDYSVSVFYTAAPIRLIELITPLDFLQDATGNSITNSLFIPDMSRFIAVFPLVLACSFRTLPPHNHVFKPEYVIPQMLMDYVKNNAEKIHGIKYRSTKLDLTSNSSFSPYNYVFPAKRPIDEDNHSVSLKNIFKWSTPVKILDDLHNYKDIEERLIQETQSQFELTDKNFEPFREGMNEIRRQR